MQRSSLNAAKRNTAHGKARSAGHGNLVGGVMLKVNMPRSWRPWAAVLAAGFQCFTQEHEKQPARPEQTSIWFSTLLPTTYLWGTQKQSNIHPAACAKKQKKSQGAYYTSLLMQGLALCFRLIWPDASSHNHTHTGLALGMAGPNADALTS